MHKCKPRSSAVRKCLYIVLYLVITAAFFLLDINMDIWNDEKFKNL